MSTKIYNAFIFDGNAELLIEILKDIKIGYYDHLKKNLTSLNFSAWTLKKDRYPFLPSDLTWKEFKEELEFPDYQLEDIFRIEKKRGEHHPFNIDASVVIYFSENKIYVQFFGLPRDFEKVVLTKYNHKFQDYHYQNNTDMSNYDWDNEPWNSMTEERQNELNKEWSERYRVWEKIMPNYTSAPVDCGLTFDFAPHGYQLYLLCHSILDVIK